MCKTQIGTMDNCNEDIQSTKCHHALSWWRAQSHGIAYDWCRIEHREQGSFIYAMCRNMQEREMLWYCTRNLNKAQSPFNRLESWAWSLPMYNLCKCADKNARQNEYVNVSDQTSIFTHDWSLQMGQMRPKMTLGTLTTMRLSPLKSCIKEFWLKASLSPHFPSV